MTLSLSEISVSSCETHHLIGGNPLYSKKFSKILKYHEPGLAPVLDEEGAYHIDLKGSPVYKTRYERTFGFYQHRAAVQSSSGWLHILPDGSPLYKERYQWCGNFQEGTCAVCNHQCQYFHINLEGQPLYSQKYSYVGDYKDGFAVVSDEKGKHSHIDKKGNFLHSYWFNQLDVFHKGFARAKDEQGWGHIDKQGHFVYQERYAIIEPFYNGLAHVEDFIGRLLLIDEQGKTVKVLHNPSSFHDKRDELSTDMVGFWKTWTLSAAIEFKVPDYLPGDLNDIADKTKVPLSKLTRLLKALWELDIVYPIAPNRWDLTEKGQLLKPVNSSFMAAAGLMWGQVNSVWKNLANRLRQSNDQHYPSFKEEETNKDLLKAYHQAIDGYAMKDFSEVVCLPFWKNHKHLLGFGRCSYTLIPSLLEKYPNLNGIIFHDKKTPHHLKAKRRLQNESWDINNPWPVSVDAVLFPRFLHYFPDVDVFNFLQRTKSHLRKEGALYILEMILEENTPMGGLFDLNMLVETGGKVRSIKDWEALFAQSNLQLIDRHVISSVLTVLKVMPQ